LHARLRPDLLLAAALLHDAGRTVELGRAPASRPPTGGGCSGKCTSGCARSKARPRGSPRGRPRGSLNCLARPPAAGPAAPGWAVLFAIAASFGGMLGLFAYYRGMQAGAMSVVAPIAGVSAIIPVIFGIATGDHPSAPQIAGIACALVGVLLASIEHHEGSRR